MEIIIVGVFDIKVFLMGTIQVHLKRIPTSYSSLATPHLLVFPRARFAVVLSLHLEASPI